MKGHKGNYPFFNVFLLPAMCQISKWRAIVSERCATPQKLQNTNLCASFGFLKKISSDLLGFFVVGSVGSFAGFGSMF